MTPSTPVHRLDNVFTSVITNESSSLPRPSSQEDHGKSDFCVLGSSRGVHLPAQWVTFRVSTLKNKNSHYLHLCVMIHNISLGAEGVELRKEQNYFNYYKNDFNLF